MFDAIGCIVASKYFFFLKKKNLMIVLVYSFFDNSFGLFLMFAANFASWVSEIFD